MRYDTAGSLLNVYEEFCSSHHFPFERHRSLRPHDDTTLFCVAGMQRHKPKFGDPDYTGTLCDVQSCLRLDDLEEVGDGTHYLLFDMLGMFSFRQLTIATTIDLWMEYLRRIGVRPDYVTVHPRRRYWSRLYDKHRVDVRLDSDCTWTDGEQVGFCTEFFVGDLEIGNIVNPLGNCIDVGFGLERLMLVCGGESPTVEGVLTDSVLRIVESGYRPSNKRQGYVLRRLLRRMVRDGIELDHPFWHDEKQRQRRVRERYLRLRDKHPDKSPQWWWDTHGVDL